MEAKLNKTKVAIATITWARNQGEKVLLMETMKILSRQNFPIVVSDGGSTEDFLNYLGTLSNVRIKRFHSPGICEQSVCSLNSAKTYRTDYVLYTESDKKFFLKRQLNNILESVNKQRDWDILIPSRSVTSFQTFPETQRNTEKLINQLAGTMFGKKGDYLYGPLLIKTELIDLLSKLEDDIGWGWRMYLIGIAISKGYKIKHIELDLPCPPHQRIESKEDKTYRLLQLKQNLEGIMLSNHYNNKG
ncbi:hypothetical protein KC799_05345 [candidate division KSB1 bacterium]|nr:hypothetical protein [candidate division KSB1 bacterium]